MSDQRRKVVAQPVDTGKIKKLWRIALILGVVTVTEFLFAVMLPRGLWLIILFVTLTLVKAFYIVSEFMHLKYEAKILIGSILIPLIFLVWLVIALLVEGNTILEMLNFTQANV
ncbi:MAG: cytochrome C oxidase subunit IV family protein [Cytophagales bacterium]|nr:cytochrome C oxidase subunit IV family protein [Cytophagales bacterium]